MQGNYIRLSADLAESQKEEALYIQRNESKRPTTKNTLPGKTIIQI